MRLVTKALFAVVLMFAARPAKADIYLEPYLGYHMGKMEITTAAGNHTWTASGTAIGARVGYSLPIFFVGVDYSLGTGKADIKDNPSGAFNSGDFNSSQLFAVVGARLPLIRGYAGYGLLNDNTMKGSGGDTTLKGSAIKLGVGFSGLPFIAVNFEMITSTYNKLSSGGTETDIGSGKPYEKAGATTYMLNVSLPLTF